MNKIFCLFLIVILIIPCGDLQAMSVPSQPNDKEDGYPVHGGGRGGYGGMVNGFILSCATLVSLLITIGMYAGEHESAARIWGGITIACLVSAFIAIS